MNPDLNTIVRSMVAIIPSQCGCRGGGWILTDYDTLHECPMHFRGQPNNECELTEEERAAFPWRETRLKLDREAYLRIRGDAIDDLVAAGIHPDAARQMFTKRVATEIPRGISPTAEDWLKAAQYAAQEAEQYAPRSRGDWGKLPVAKVMISYLGRDG